MKCRLSAVLLTLAIAGSPRLAPAQQPDPLQALQLEIVGLEARIEAIESVRAIKRLQYAYGHYVEFGLWHDFADLFTEDAVTNYQQGAQGREAVRQLFLQQVGQGRLGLAEGRIYPHILFQPVIHLGPDGRTARGRWRILAMLGGLGGSATWYSGVYENEYVLEDSGWMISNLRSEPLATAAYTDTGWREAATKLPAHYAAAAIARPVPDSALSRASERVNEVTSPEALAARVSELTRRATLLTDQADVTNLLNSYAAAVNLRQWDQAAALFAEDGTLEIGQRGVYAGPASVRRALPAVIGSNELDDHFYLQVLVTVAPDGRTANARGVELIFSALGDNAQLTEGVFENTFVKEDDTWRIRSVHFYPRMIVDADEGWARSARPAPGPSRDVPPDRPPSSRYEIYPAFMVVPFHFDNPATARPPQYPEGTPARPAISMAQPPPASANTADLEARLAALERIMARAEAYDIAENLLDASGYSNDDTSVFVDQVLQPVIEVAPDGHSATIRARNLDLGGVSGAEGYWSAGTLEGHAGLQDDTWKLDSLDAREDWRAAYPGGWTRTQ